MRARVRMAAGVLVLVGVGVLACACLRGPRYEWNVGWVEQVPQAGTYQLSMGYQAPAGPADFVVELNGKSAPFHVARTGVSTTLDLGAWDLKRGGRQVVEIHRDSVTPPLIVEWVDLARSHAP